MIRHRDLALGVPNLAPSPLRCTPARNLHAGSHADFGYPGGARVALIVYNKSQEDAGLAGPSLLYLWSRVTVKRLPPWFDRLTTSGEFPFVLSLSKDRKRPLLKLLDRR